MDFLAIGDITTDTFIKLKEATISCDPQGEDCIISMRWGDKIPFESATTVDAVGNSPNAAFSAGRLGLSAGVLAWIGTDKGGEANLAALEAEHIDATHLARVEGVETNHHYVLWYESERSILIKQNVFPYAFPEGLAAPKTIYLSSLGETAGALHADIASFVSAHPETKLVFQPGTFQIKMGAEPLKQIYANTYLFVCNKEEAERILAHAEPQDLKKLLLDLKALGPKIVIITDGRNGAYAYDGANMWKVPLYPDPRPPFERTGAGDAFASTVAVALELGEPLEKALLWGPINSMSVVQQIGARAGLLSREALLKYLEDAPESYKVEPF